MCKVKKSTVKQVGNIVDDTAIGFKNPQRGRVYSVEGISPALNCCQGGGLEPKIIVKEATKKGYTEAYPNDSVNIGMPNSETRRGRVGHGVANTLTTQDEMGVVVETAKILTPKRNDYGKKIRKRYENHEVDEKRHNMTELVEREDNISNTLSTVQKDNLLSVSSESNLRIRKLTPKECFRLQGWPDEYFYKAQQFNSDSQLYKQAGNGVTVNVINAIAKELNNG